MDMLNFVKFYFIYKVYLGYHTFEQNYTWIVGLVLLGYLAFWVGYFFLVVGYFCDPHCVVFDRVHFAVFVVF